MGQGRQGTDPHAEKEGEITADIGKAHGNDQQRLESIADRRLRTNGSQDRGKRVPKKPMRPPTCLHPGKKRPLLAIRRLNTCRHSGRTRCTGTSCCYRPTYRLDSTLEKVRNRCRSRRRAAPNSSSWRRPPCAWQRSLVGNNMSPRTTAARATTTLQAVPPSSKCRRRIES